MTRTLNLGFIPLVDAAPLIIAAELGFAKAEGVHFELHRAASWSMLRDMLDFGQVDAAQMLSVVPVAKALGLGGGVSDFDAPMVLSMNGQVIGVSAALAASLRAQGHNFDFANAAAAGRALSRLKGPLRVAVPFPFSMHTELLHYWLDGLGLTMPAGTVILTVPPPSMASALAAGEIDAFCVGEPWGSHAVETAGAELLLPGTAIWSQAPEKVLATRKDWCEAEPELAGSALRALWRACRWLTDPHNHVSASELLVRQGYLDVQPELITRALSGLIVSRHVGPDFEVPQFLEFHGGAANFPWRSQAAWIAAQLAKRHGLPLAESLQKGRAVFRSDLYRRFLAPDGVPMPSASDKAEGLLSEKALAQASRGGLILNRNSFFDGQIFDPTDGI